MYLAFFYPFDLTVFIISVTPSLSFYLFLDYTRNYTSLEI